MILNDPDLEYLIGSNQNDLSFYDNVELNAFYKCAGMICSSITSTVFYAVIKLFKCYLKGFKNDLMVEMVVTDRQRFSQTFVTCCSTLPLMVCSLILARRKFFLNCFINTNEHYHKQLLIQIPMKCLFIDIETKTEVD